MQHQFLCLKSKSFSPHVANRSCLAKETLDSSVRITVKPTYCQFLTAPPTIGKGTYRNIMSQITRSLFFFFFNSSASDSTRDIRKLGWMTNYFMPSPHCLNLSTLFANFILALKLRKTGYWISTFGHNSVISIFLKDIWNFKNSVLAICVIRVYIFYSFQSTDVFVKEWNEWTLLKF